MTHGRFIERRGHHFAAHGALHLGHFFRALVDQQHEQFGFRMVGRDGMRNVLQHHGLTRFGRRHQQRALAAADRGNHVDDAAGDVLLGLDVAFEDERLVRVQRRQVLEHDAVLDRFGRLRVDLVDLHQREVALAVLRGADFAFDRVTGVQIETADLRRADVDVIRAGQIRRFRRAQKTEAVGQHFKRAVTENRFPLFRLLFQDGKHQLLFAHALGVINLQLSRHFQQLGHVQGFQFCQMHRRKNGKGPNGQRNEKRGEGEKVERTLGETDWLQS